MKELSVFTNVSTQEFVPLSSSAVKQVIHFALGPKGTNIGQACEAWTKEKGVEEKTEIVFCPTPEESLEQARKVKENGVLPIFWTCAVFYALNKLFFYNPDVYPFLFQYNMPLDTMQLCVPAEMQKKEWDNKWLIASHPSPSPLVSNLKNIVINTKSNSQAAILCAQGEVEACITTAQAAKIHGLVPVHEFGSPTMVFFGGTTQHGMNILLGK
jgi:prephenate dehydratase